MPSTSTVTTASTVPGLAFAEAVVDLEAVAHNTRLFAGPVGGLMAVVKADGFGHGLVPVARTALAHGASWLGVTSCAEAGELRAAGVTAPILSWLHLPGQDFAEAILTDVDLAASSAEHLLGIARSAQCVALAARVQLKIDTGLSRNGSTADEWPELLRLAHRLELAGTIRVRGIWSHLSAAEDPATVPPQIRRFEDALAAAGSLGLHPPLRHLANSAATLGVPGSRYDLVRVGIGLYGVEPLPDKNFGLRPAMTLRGRAVMVKRVPRGTGVSYHHDYTTTGDTTLVLVPLGFADGVPRTASGHGEVSIHGTRYPIAGRVAMDQFVVDVGDAPVRIGDEVVLFGPGDDGEPTVIEWACWAGTNPHEILTGIGHRVPRRYLPAL
jgi:alanine racemase